MKTAVWGMIQSDIRREGGPDQVIERCKRHGIETYLGYPFPLDEEDRHVLAYPSAIADGKCENLLGPLASAGKREGIRVEPWWLPTSMTLADDTPEQRQQWAYQSATPDGNPKHGKVLCLSWPEVRKRAIRILQDMIETAGTDLAGIHMDVIRYTDNPYSIEQPCQCEACRKQYKQLMGIDTLTAEDLKQPGFMFKYLQFRGRCVRELVEQAREITNKAGIGLSMAARADYQNWALPEGQDWVDWARSGLIDFLCTMNYFIDRETHRSYAQHHGRLMSGIDGVAHLDGIGRKTSFGELPPESLEDFIKDALSAGSDGVCIYNYDAMTDTDFEVFGKLCS